MCIIGIFTDIEPKAGVVVAKSHTQHMLSAPTDHAENVATHGWQQKCNLLKINATFKN